MLSSASLLRLRGDISQRRLRPTSATPMPSHGSGHSRELSVYFVGCLRRFIAASCYDDLWSKSHGFEQSMEVHEHERVWTTIAAQMLIRVMSAVSGEAQSYLAYSACCALPLGRAHGLLLYLVRAAIGVVRSTITVRIGRNLCKLDDQLWDRLRCWARQRKLLEQGLPRFQMVEGNGRTRSRLWSWSSG